MRRMFVGWLMLCMLSTSVAASPDAAAGYLKAFEALPPRESEVMQLASKDPWTDEERHSYIAATQSAMVLLVEASTKPFEGWGTPTPLSLEALYRYVGPTNALAHVGFRCVRAHLEQGEVDQAFELLLALNQLGLAVDDDPALVCRLTGGGIRSGSIAAAVGWLGLFSAEQRNQLSETLGQPLAVEVVGQRVVDTLAESVAFMLSSPPGQWQLRARGFGADASVANDFDELRWSEQLRRLGLRVPDVRRVFSSPLPDQIRVGRELDRSVAELGSLAEAISPGFERMATISLRITVDAHAFAAACDVISRADAAIQDHIDPTTGRPFILRRESDTVFEVHSGLRMKEVPYGLRVGDPSRSRTWE